MTIVGTPIASADLSDLSYITTTADFEDRLEDDPRTSAIALRAAATATQEWYLVRATKNIDQLPFVGVKSVSTQALEHPRKILVNPETESPWGDDIESDDYGYKADEAVPECVKAATVEEAIALYSAYGGSSEVNEAALQAAGVSSFSLGKLSMSFVPGSGSRYGSLHSKEAYDLLLDSGYIELAPLIM